MSDLLADGATWLEQQRHEHLSHAVTYWRAGESLTLPATVGRTEWEENDEYGRVTRWESRDFLVRASDLSIGGVATLPSPGDRITESDDSGKRWTYEVLAPGGAAAFRYSDPGRVTIRIHTKLVESE